MQKMKALLTAIVCVLLFALPAEGAEWVLIAENVDDDAFFIDIGNIKYMRNEQVRAWIKTITKNNHPYCADKGKLCNRIIQQIQFDCKSDTLEVLHEEIYTPSNSFRLSEPEELNWYWLYPTPDSVRYRIHAVVCSSP